MKTLCFMPNTPVAILNDLSVIVRASGSHFVECKTESDVFDEMSKTAASGQNILLTSQSETQLSKKFSEKYPHNLIVLMINSPLQKVDKSLRDCLGIHSFVAYSNNEIDPCDLTVTLKKLRTKDIFGVRKYLKNSCQTTSFDIYDPLDKTVVLRHVEDFVRSLGGDNPMSRFAQYSSRVSELLDELVLNALTQTSDLPIEAQSHKDFKLSHSNCIRVEWGFDGELFGVSVRDSSGMLTKESVLSYLDCTMVLDVMDAKHVTHFAFKSMFDRVHKFIVNVHPGFMTEIVCILRFDRRLRDFDGRLRSFHYFTI